MSQLLPRPEHFPYDSPLRWQIASRTDSHGTYIVDIGLRECQCRYHQCEVGPKLRKGLQPKLCTHYHIARDRFATWAAWAFQQQDPNLKHDKSI
jgi:hypothetical protein